MKTFRVYNGTAKGYFHQDYSLVEATSFEEAVDKIELEWSFDAITQLFVVDKQTGNGRLYRVTPARAVKLELAAA